ncbi:MAG: hypothetical protein P1U63_11700 [Coxiellaceae bacterium]|nr:hypothetical protein [Coxiellaceae bacterium]
MPNIFTEAGLAQARNFLNDCVGLMNRYASAEPVESFDQRMARITNLKTQTRAAAAAEEERAAPVVVGDADNKIHLPNGATFDLPAFEPSIRIDITAQMWKNPSVRVLVQAIYWMNRIVSDNSNEIFDQASPQFNASPELIAEGFEYNFFVFRGLMDGGVESFAPLVSDQLSSDYTGLIIDFLSRINVSEHINADAFKGILPAGGLMKVGAAVAGFLAGRDYPEDLKNSAISAMALNRAVLEPSVELVARAEQSVFYIENVKQALLVLKEAAGRSVLGANESAYLKKYCQPFAQEVLGDSATMTHGDIANILRLQLAWMRTVSQKNIAGIHNQQFLTQLTLFQSSMATGNQVASCLPTEIFPTFETLQKDQNKQEQEWLGLFKMEEELRAMLAPTAVDFGPSLRESQAALYNPAEADSRAKHIQQVAAEVYASFAHSAEKHTGLFRSGTTYKNDPAKGKLADRVRYAFDILAKQPTNKSALIYAYAVLLDTHKALNHLLGRSGPYEDYAHRNTFSKFGTSLAAAIEKMSPIMLAMDVSTDSEFSHKLFELKPGVAVPIELSRAPTPSAEVVTPVDLSSTSASSGGSDSDAPSPVTPVDRVQTLLKLSITNTGGGASSKPAVAAVTADDLDDFVLVSPT